jgi:hypothetical protein
MSVNKTFAGTVYSIPNTRGESGWETQLSQYLQDLADKAATNIFLKQAVRKATASPVTVSASTDCTIIVDLAIAGASTVNLPAGADKQIFVIVDGKGDASTNNITIDANGSETIEGSLTKVIRLNRECLVLQYSSSAGDWKVIGGYVPNMVGGPASATDNAIARFDGTAGKVLQSQSITKIDDSGNITIDLINPILGRIHYQHASGADKVFLVQTITGTNNFAIGADYVGGVTKATFGTLTGLDSWSIKAIQYDGTGAVTLGPVGAANHVFNGQTVHKYNANYGGIVLQGNVTGDTSRIYASGSSASGGNNGILEFYSNRGDYGNVILAGSFSGTGAWTLGPSGFAGTHTAIGLLQVSNNLAPGFVLHRATASEGAGIHFSFRNNATGGTSGTELVGYAGTAATGGMDFRFGGTTMGSYTAAGVWTLGPSSGATAGHVIQSSVAASTSVIYCRKYTGGDTTSNYYLTFTTDTTIQGYIWNNAAGNIELLNTSDVNLKENIRDADYGLNEVLALRPVKFDWKTGAAQNVKGFIAQEVQPILPESVTHMPDGNLGMGMHEFIPVIVSAIKEQNAIIIALQARIDGLKARIEALENK